MNISNDKMVLLRQIINFLRQIPAVGGIIAIILPVVMIVSAVGVPVYKNYKRNSLLEKRLEKNYADQGISKIKTLFIAELGYLKQNKNNNPAASSRPTAKIADLKLNLPGTKTMSAIDDGTFYCSVEYIDSGPIYCRRLNSQKYDYALVLDTETDIFRCEAFNDKSKEVCLFYMAGGNASQCPGPEDKTTLPLAGIKKRICYDILKFKSVEELLNSTWQRPMPKEYGKG